jgi:hypothetical protein
MKKIKIDPRQWSLVKLLRAYLSGYQLAYRVAYNDVWVDLILIFGAVIFFSIYANDASSLSDEALQRSKLAIIDNGTAERKLSGNPMFSAVGAGAPLYNHDIIWVKEGIWTSVRFNDDSLMRVHPGTLLMISRTLSGDRQGGHIDLIAGQVDISHHWKWPWQTDDFEVTTKKRKIEISEGQSRTVSAEEDSQAVAVAAQNVPRLNLQESPEPVSSPAVTSAPKANSRPAPGASRPVLDEALLRAIHPKLDSILLSIKGKPITIVFAWPQAISGRLSVKNSQGTEIAAMNLKNQTNAKVPLGVDASYQWTVSSSKEGKLLGPFEFKVYSAKTHPLSSLIRNETKAVIEMAN